MSLTLKVGSLVIRTLSKPIANYIKKNAREHERFRRVCVSFAQRLHRIDMRMRLGLLQDPAAIEAQVAREVRAAEAKRLKTQAPTVKTEAQTIADAEAAAKEKDQLEKKVKSEHKLPRIRPLSESKAIETGANFISESFLFMVAGGLILFENRRSKKKSEKEHDRRDDEIESIRADNETLKAEMEWLKQTLQGPNALAAVPTSTTQSDGTIVPSGKTASSQLITRSQANTPDGAASGPKVQTSSLGPDRSLPNRPDR